MPEQLSNPNQTDARAHLSRRSTRAASLSVAAAVTIAAWCAPAAVVASAQNAAQPRTAPAQKASRPADAKAKATGAQEKEVVGEKKEQGKKPAPAASASEITRARRAAADAAPPAATSTAAPAAPSAAAAAATPAAATKPKPVPSPTPSVVPTVAPPSVVAAPVASAPEGSGAAKSMSEEGEIERLRAEIKDAKPGAERARLQRSLVERLVALKRQPEALDALRLMIHEDRFDPPFFFNTGNALARLGDASAAEDAYRKAISQRRGNYSRALNNLGVILIRQGHWDEAQETLGAALVQENFAYPEASYNLGRLHLLRGEADLAIREWLRTLRLEPMHAEAAAALARAYAEDGDPARGINVLDAFVARSTRTGAGVPREIGEARRDLAAAADVTATTAPTTAEDAEPANSKSSGDDGSAGGERDAVRPAVRPAGAKFPAHKVDPATYDLLRSARAARERGGIEEAVKHYRGVLARSPGNYFAPANIELGTALMNLRRDEEAVAALLPLTQKDAARYPVAFYHLGRLFERGGQPSPALDHYRRAAELYGDANPQVLIDVSRLRERAGDHAGALDAMNDYAASMGRQGTVPSWVAERQAKLRQKAAAATASSAPNNSTPTRQ